MYLVCQELSSGYLFFETSAQNRSADTWAMEVKKILDKFKTATILYFVSDRAKALIHLAKETYKVNSIAYLFHFKYCINCLLTLALSAQLRAAKNVFEMEGQKSGRACN